MWRSRRPAWQDVNETFHRRRRKPRRRVRLLGELLEQRALLTADQKRG